MSQQADLSGENHSQADPTSHQPVRQVRPSQSVTGAAIGGGQNKSNILKSSNIKGLLVAEVASSTKRTNYGQRQQNRNQNILPSNQTRPGGYSSTKPSQRRVAASNVATSSKGTSNQQTALNQSFKQMRAQSRRKVPTHLFHPAAGLNQDEGGSPEPLSANPILQTSATHVINSTIGQTLESQRIDGGSTLFRRGQDTQGQVIDQNSLESQFSSLMAPPLKQPQTVASTATKYKTNSNHNVVVGGHHAPAQATIQISRDDIQPPSEKPLRHGSQVKRRSVLTQRAAAQPKPTGAREYGPSASRNCYDQNISLVSGSSAQNLHQLQANNATAVTSAQDDDSHRIAEPRLQPPTANPKQVKQRIKQQVQKLRTLGSQENLMEPNSQSVSFASQHSTVVGAAAAQKRKNSSLSRRDMQAQGLRVQRRKSQSNPRHKMQSNALQNMTVNVGQAHQNVPQYSQSTRRGARSNQRSVQRGSRQNQLGSLGHKYGYKQGNGPIEAYSTASQQNQNGTNTHQANATHLQMPLHQIFSSLDGSHGAFQHQHAQTKPITKKTSANLLPQTLPLAAAQTIQVSQDMNPMNWQYLSSIDRTASIDSACYDFVQGQPQPMVHFQPKQHQDADKRTNPVSQGFSEMLKQTILSKAQENTQKRNSLNVAVRQGPDAHKDSLMFNESDLEAALMSLDQSQLTQNLMKEFMNARNDSLVLAANSGDSQAVSQGQSASRKQSQAENPTGLQKNTKARLESLIKQLVVREEITHSPNIQQRRAYNTGGQVTVAHQSLQAAAHNLSLGGKRTVHKVTNFASSLYSRDAVLKQEHSAEDLLRIARKEESSTTHNGSPARKPPHAVGPLPPKQIRPSQLNMKTFRPGLQDQAQNNAASFGQLHGALPQANATGGNEDLNLGETFGFPKSLVNGLTTQPINAGQALSTTSQNPPQLITTMTQPDEDVYRKPMVSSTTIEVTGSNPGNNLSIDGDLERTNRLKFLSLDQSQLPNAKTTLGSDASIDDVYHKTLNAYQNDINQLYEINRTRKEISTRIIKHQSLLQSIQGASKNPNKSSSGANGPTVAQTSGSAVLMDSMTHPPLSSIGDATVLQPGQDPHAQATLQPLDSKALQNHQQYHTTMVMPDGSSLRASLIDPHSRAITVEEHTRMDKLDHSAGGHAPQQASQQQTSTASPIVGRYRLKNPGPGGRVSIKAVPTQSITTTAGKRQQAYTMSQYETAGQVAVSSTRATGHYQPDGANKRTKSVRPRRPAGSSNLRGVGGGPGRRAAAEKQQPNAGASVRSKFDSIAQAYNSQTGHVGYRDDYASKSQRSIIGGFGQLFAGGAQAQAHGPQVANAIASSLTPSQHQIQMANQMLSATGGGTSAPNKRHLQTLDPPGKSNLQQTYGVTQKLNKNSNQLVAGKRPSNPGTMGSGGSVPKQRQGGQFASNLRPSALKQTERSLSHNRNRAQQQHSLQQKPNSFIAQHTYLSAGSGSIGSNNQQQAVLAQKLNGSAQYPFTAADLSGSANIVDGGVMNDTTVSPINTKQTRSFKYNARAGKSQAGSRPRGGGHSTSNNGGAKSTSRTRGTVVANSTQLIGPGQRKTSRILQKSQIPSNRETRQTQLSHQQVYHFRGSHLQPAGSHGQQTMTEHTNSVRVSPARDQINSPERKTKKLATAQQRTFDKTRVNATPEPKGDAQVAEFKTSGVEEKSPEPQGANKLRLLNKITRSGGTTPSGVQQSHSQNDQIGESLGMSIGGQEIIPQSGPSTSGLPTQPFLKAHNLRYSSAVNDFGQASVNPAPPSAAVYEVDNSSQALHRSDLSQEAQDRQNQAMKLLNEDNPFADPTPTLAQKSPQKGVDNTKDLDGSIVEHVSERESKNTAATQGLFVASSSAAPSSTSATTLTAHFKSQSHRRVIIGAGGQAIQGSGNPTQFQGGSSIVARRSLLGMAALRRSETTEDSQQCKYNDGGALIMSSLPMPMHSIKQVIAEEEAAEEQDERTTNKESKKDQAAPSGASGGNAPQQRPSTSGGESQPLAGVSNSEEPRIMLSPSIEREIELTERQDKLLEGSIQRSDLQGSGLCDEIVQQRHEASATQENLVLMMETPIPLKSARAKPTGDSQMAINDETESQREALVIRPLSQKQQQSDRYSARDSSMRGNNMLCGSSEGSVLQLENSSAIPDVITPDINLSKAKHSQQNLPANRGSYNRGAFQRKDSPNKLLADFPPQLSESSLSAAHHRHKNKAGSDAHSDDEIEVRRGLESESQRTDMGRNPELLRQSTHSLLHKPTQAQEEKEKFGEGGDSHSNNVMGMMVARRPTKHCAESNENLISDEINVALSSSRVDEVSESARRDKAHQTRNNNYFNINEGNRDGEPSTAKKALDQSHGEVEGDDEEDGGIVGMVADAEEFKLGKII